MAFVVERVTHLKCPGCGLALKTGKATPMSMVKCPRCGETAAVPVAFGEQYHLFEKLGKGATGIVFRAVDRQLNRPVALKILRQEKGHEEAALQCLREARRLASTNHPNIVQIYDMGTHKDQHYIAMELVTGGSAMRLLRGGTLPEEARVLDLALGVARGLRAAYAVGLVHMDVKPGNILLDEKGAPKIIDFGAAQLHDRLEELSIAGTAYYIAPETLRREPASFPADMYGLGATLFYLLTGRRPFEGKDAKETAAMRLRQAAPSILDYRGNLNMETVEVVSRLLEAEPANRFASYDELIESLELARAATESVGAEAATNALAAAAAETNAAYDRDPGSRFSPTESAGLSRSSVISGQLSRSNLLGGSRTLGGSTRLDMVVKDGKKRGINPVWIAAGVPLALVVVIAFLVFVFSGDRDADPRVNARVAHESAPSQPPRRDAPSADALASNEPRDPPPDIFASKNKVTPNPAPPPTSSLEPKPKPKPSSSPRSSREPVLHLPLDAGKGEQVAGIVDGTQRIDDAGKFKGDVKWLTDGKSAAIALAGQGHVDLGSVANFRRTDEFSYGCWVFVRADEISDGAIIARADSSDRSNRGHDIYLKDRAVLGHVTSLWPLDCIRVASKSLLPVNRWTHVFMTYDGSMLAEGVKLYFDGQTVPVEITHDTLNSAIQTTAPLLLGRRSGEKTAFSGLINDVRIYERELDASEVYELTVDRQSLPAVRMSERAIAAAQRRRELVAYWSFDDTEGDRVFSPFGAHMHGTQVNTKLAEGRIGYAMEFPAEGRVDIDKPDAFDFGDSDFTITAWVRTSHPQGVILSKADPKKWDRQGKCFFIKDGKVALDVGWVGVKEGDQQIADGKWHHVAVTFDRSSQEVRLFVDGKAEWDGPQRIYDGRATNDKGAKPDKDSYVLKLGRAPDNFGVYRKVKGAARFDGRLDEVAVFSYRLDPQQIKALAEGARPSQFDTREQLAILDESRHAEGFVSLRVDDATSKSGVSLVRFENGFLHSAEVAPGDTEYIVTAKTKVPGVTAIRIETFTDVPPSPGNEKEQDAAFGLRELRVTTANGDPPPTILAATAHPENAQHPVDYAVDGDPATSWKSPGHRAVATFIFDRPITAGPPGDGAGAGDSTSPEAVIKLHFTVEPGSSLGRVRLLATSTSEPAVLAAPAPAK